MRVQLTRALAISLATVLLAPAARAADRPDVTVSSELSSYVGTDSVVVLTPTIAATVSDPTAGWRLDGHYLLDVVSAASPDIVSTASQRWVEPRNEGEIAASYKPRELGLSAAANVSSEPDYLAMTFSGAVTRDFDNKLLTVLLGGSYAHDTIGKAGTPFSMFSQDVSRGGLKLGFTRILDASSFVSVVADVFLERGDTSKPYRFIPLFTPGTSVPNGASADLVNALRLDAKVIERLPTSRERYAIGIGYGYRFRASTLRLEERLYTDSWSLYASTLDARWLFDTSKRWQVGPHVRFHGQNGVSFWRRAYTTASELTAPTLRTGDRELSPLVTATLGGTLRRSFGENDAWTFGVDANAAYTRFLDAIYVTDRLAIFGGVSLEVRK